ncbi:iron chelate uptake ABC transporter family permease subunit [Brachybacterium paraconglomeratum]|uniref:iron chelate uptake ABC transporter family permease subunit n=1 Tax=Brachybacterium paraconglomeratum TaxID=173362 RepID=UPI003A4DDBD9
MRLERTSVLAVGVVGFVGLVALADVLGRPLIAPAQVPAGLMVSLIEAPYLAWLLWRSRV